MKWLHILVKLFALSSNSSLSIFSNSFLFVSPQFSLPCNYSHFLFPFPFPFSSSLFLIRSPEFYFISFLFLNCSSFWINYLHFISLRQSSRSLYFLPFSDIISSHPFNFIFLLYSILSTYLILHLSFFWSPLFKFMFHRQYTSPSFIFKEISVWFSWGRQPSKGSVH